MSSVDMTLVEQARAIERPLPVPGVSGLYGLEANGQSYQVTDAQLREIRKRFTGEIRHGLGRVQGTVTAGMYGHADMAKLRDDQFIVSRLSEMMPSGKALLAGMFLGPASAAYLAYDIEKVRRDRAFPDELMWVQPGELLGRGRKDVTAGHLAEAATDLGAAEASAAKAVAALSKYREGVIEGAGSAIDTLEVTRDVSFAAVGIIATVVTGGSILGAAAIGTGVTTAGTVAQQAMEVHLDMRKEIDWTTIGFDAVLSFVTTLIGARLGGAATARLLGKTAMEQAAASLGKKAFAILVNDAIVGSLMGAAQGVAKEVFEEVRGKKQTLTAGQYWALVRKQLLDPKALFMNLLQGEVTRRLHTAMPPKTGGSHGEAPPLQLEEKTSTQPLQETAPQLEQTQQTISEPAASTEPAPQFIDPAAQAQSVERPEFAGMGEVFESTHEGPSNLEVDRPRTAADHPQEHVPDLGDGSGLELDRTDRSKGWGVEPEQGFELEHQGESGLELGPTEHPEGFGAAPEQGFELELQGQSDLELGPTEHPGGFGAEVDARVQEPQHQGPSGLETLDQSKKKNRIYVPPDKKKAAARRLEAWREYKRKRAELQQRNPDFAPERPTAEGYDELTKPMKVPGVAAAEPKFGAESGELTGTHERTGVFFNELNAAEIQQELRVQIDQGSGQVKKVRYRIDGGSVPAGKPVTDRNFKADPSLPVAQTQDIAYKQANAARRAAGKKPLNRGHLAQREVFKTPADQAQLAERGIEGRSIGRLDAFRSTPEALAAADQWTNVVPMTEELNQGQDWRSAENRSLDLADQNGHVYVEIVPDYGSAPERLSDGTPIPERFQRIVIGPDGTILESAPYENQ